MRVQVTSVTQNHFFTVFSAIAEHRKRQLCLANENVLAKSAEVERLTKEFDEAR